jgi:hypothetical protein
VYNLELPSTAGVLYYALVCDDHIVMVVGDGPRLSKNASWMTPSQCTPTPPALPDAGLSLAAWCLQLQSSWHFEGS